MENTDLLVLILWFCIGFLGSVLRMPLFLLLAIGAAICFLIAWF